MPVSRLGSAASSDSTNALAHTVSAGTNRALIVGVTQEVASPTQLAVGYGGQSMSHIVGINVGDATDQRVDLYFLNNSGITSASDNQIDVTSPPATYGIFVQAYENCVQTTPTVIDSEAVTGDSDPLTNIQISSIVDSVVIGIGGSGNVSTGVTWAGTNPLTALVNSDLNATAHGAMADRISTGTETVNHNLTFTTAPNRVAGAAFRMDFLVAEGITDVVPSEFDFDNADVDIDGLNFEASQGSGAVYISDASTLAGSVNEVEIDGAINTWSDTQINLDFTGMSQTEIDNLHTLGPSASRWIIVTNASADEYSFQITLHRPEAIEMVLSSETGVPGGTSSRITGMSGTFGGGRIEETAAQNPSTTTVNVGNNGRREDVWNMQAKPNSRDTTYDFRLRYGGEAPDTTTQTAQLTVVGITTANGAPSITLPTASGAAEVINTSSGSPSITLPTASGAAEIIKKATGAVATALIVSAGTASVFVVHTADGAPSVFLPTASGAAEVINTADGSPDIAIPTAAGTATITKSADGAPVIVLPTASGAAEVINTADGSPSVFLPTSSGTAEIIKFATGGPSTSLITSSGSASVGSGANGSPDVYLPIAAGTAVLERSATGSPSVTLPTATGVAEVINSATGDTDITLPTAAGTASMERAASGSPSITPITSDGFAAVGSGANGSPDVYLPVAVGTATLERNATGSPSTILPTAAGVAEVIKLADGGPSTLLPTSVGTAEIIKTADGGPSTVLITSVGSASKTSTSGANGAPPIAIPTAAGTAAIDRSATGSPSTILPTASGAAEIIKLADGGPSAFLPTAAGVADVSQKIPASGAPSITLPTAAGSAEIGNVATGAPSITLPTATGVAEVINSAIGSPTTYLPVAAGVAEAVKVAVTGVETTSVTDDFNRAGPGLGLDWVNPVSPWPYGFEINANQLRVDTVGQFAFAQYDGTLPQTPDQFAEVALYNVDVSTDYWESSLSLRESGDNATGEQYYFGLWADGGNPNPISFYFSKLYNDTWTTPVQFSTGIDCQDLPDGSIWRVETIGSYLYCYLDGQLVWKGYDTDIDGSIPMDSLSIQHYVDVDADDVVWDNFRVGDISIAIAPVESSGTGLITRKANGSPSIALPTSAGTGNGERSASGSPSIALIIAQGIGNKQGLVGANGNPVIPVPTAAGVARRIVTANSRVRTNWIRHSDSPRSGYGWTDVTDAGIPIDGFSNSIYYEDPVGSWSRAFNPGGTLGNYTPSPDPRILLFSAYMEMDNGSQPVAGPTNDVGNDFFMIIDSSNIVDAGRYTYERVSDTIWRVWAYHDTSTATIGTTGIYKWGTQSPDAFKTTGWQLEVVESISASPSPYLENLTGDKLDDPNGLFIPRAIASGTSVLPIIANGSPSTPSPLSSSGTGKIIKEARVGGPALIIDDFNRAGVGINHDIGPNWLEPEHSGYDGKPQIQSPGVVQMDDVKFGFASHVIQPGPDQFCEFTVHGQGVTGPTDWDSAPWLWFRATNGQGLGDRQNTGYYVYFTGSTEWEDPPNPKGYFSLDIYRWDKNPTDYTWLDSWELYGWTGFPDGTKMRIECIGDQISVWLDVGIGWERKLTITESVHMGNEVGFGIDNFITDISYVSRFEAGPLGAGIQPLNTLNTVICDNFNRADAPDAGAGWLEGTPGSTRAPIVSNQLVAPSVASWDRRVESFSPNQFAEAKVYGHTTATAYTYVGFHLRQDINDLGGDRLMTWVDHIPSTGEFRVYFGYKTLGQAHYTGPTVILQASDYAEGFLIRAEVVGDIVTFYMDGEEIYSTNKGSFVTGTDGIDNLISISLFKTNAPDTVAFDDFCAGSFSEARRILTANVNTGWNTQEVDDFERETLDFTDNFNRTELGSSYIDVNPYDSYYNLPIIVNNTLRPDYAPGQTGFMAVYDQVHGPDQAVECTVVEFDSNPWNVSLDLIVRVTLTPIVEWYGLYISTDGSGTDFWLYRNDNGSSVLINEVWLPNDPISVDDKFRLQIQDNTITTYWDRGNGWETIQRESDSVLPTGLHTGIGMDQYIDGLTIAIDDFKARELEPLGSDWWNNPLDDPSTGYMIEDGAVRTINGLFPGFPHVRSNGFTINTNPLGSDQYSEVEITGYVKTDDEGDTGGNPYYWIDIYPVVRFTIDANGDESYYYLYVSTDSEDTLYCSVVKWRKTSPPVTTFGAFDSYPTVVGELPDGLRLKIEAEGNVISGYIKRPTDTDWELVSQGTDNQGDALTSGLAGFGGWDFSDTLKKDIESFESGDMFSRIPFVNADGHIHLTRFATSEGWHEHVFDDFNSDVIVTDDFNRLGPELGVPWVEHRSDTFLPVIINSSVVDDDGIQGGSAIYDFDLNDDQFSEIEITGFQNFAGSLFDTFAILFLKHNAPDITSTNAYYYWMAITPLPGDIDTVRVSFSIRRQNGGGSLQFASEDVIIPGTLPDGIKFKLKCVNRTVSGYYDIGGGEQFIFSFYTPDAPHPIWQGGRGGFTVYNFLGISQVYVDNFSAGNIYTNLSDNWMTPSWGATNHIEIVNSRIQSTDVGGATCSAQYISRDLGLDQFAQFEIYNYVPNNYGSQIGFWFRGDSVAQTGYVCFIYSDDNQKYFEMYRIDQPGDVWTSLDQDFFDVASGNGFIPDGTVLRLEQENDRFKFYYGDELLTDSTDLTYSNTETHLFMSVWNDSGNAALDNFRMGNTQLQLPMVIGNGAGLQSDWAISNYVSENRELQGRFYDNWWHTPIQWENILIETNSLTEWVRFTNDSDESEQKTVGSDPEIYRYFGKVTVEVYVRPNSGANRALQLADLAAEIWRGARFTTLSMGVPKLDIYGIREGWYRVDVECPYYRDSIQLRSS